ANRFLSRYVNGVAVSFPGAEEQFPNVDRVVYTGNPRATSVRHAKADDGYAALGLPSGKPLVVVVGGSGGARALNEAMADMAPAAAKRSDIQFVFITGNPYYEHTSSRIH